MEQLSKCINCNTIMFDEDPTDLKTQPELIAPKNTRFMIKAEVDGEFVWCCPFCLTDEYLIDVHSINQLK